MAKRPRIAVVGSANVDLTTFTDQFPKPGETIFGQKFDMGFGGKGANQAVAARLCGSDVFMIARVGDDLFGPATIKNFEKLGIDASQVRQVPGWVASTRRPSRATCRRPSTWSCSPALTHTRPRRATPITCDHPRNLH